MRAWLRAISLTLFIIGLPFALVWVASAIGVSHPRPMLLVTGTVHQWWLERDNIGYMSGTQYVGPIDMTFVGHDWFVGFKDVVKIAWTPAAVFALATRKMRPAVNDGHCAVRRYDLRATTDRCPECGTTPQQ